MKKPAIIGLGLLTLFLLSGCGRNALYFEGKLMSPVKVEEILEDRLEEENDVEYEVIINEESE